MLTDLIFDFFGTLASYTAGPFRAERFDATHRLLAEHGYVITYDRFVREYTRVSDALEQQARATGVEFNMDDTGRAFFTACFEQPPSPHLIERFSESFVEEWNRATVFYPEIQPFLARLARRYRLSIISNTHYPALVHRNLEAMRIASLFAQVVTSVEHGRRKPDPRIFRDALAGLGVSPDRALFIGDSHDDDYRGAAAAGLRCVLIDPGGLHTGSVELRIASLFELERLLE